MQINQDLINIPQQIDTATEELNKLEDNLQYLRSQVIILERLLRDAFTVGIAANDKVAVAKQNLDATVARYER